MSGWFPWTVASIGGTAIIIGGLGAIWTKAVSPLLAKPLAKALRKELAEEVLLTLQTPEAKAVMQEMVAYETRTLLREFRGFSRRLERLEDKQAEIYEATVPKK